MSLIFCSTGSKHCIMKLAKYCHTCAHVIGIDSNFSLVSSAVESNAFLTISAVISPSAAMSRSAPIGTCI